jgi:UDP-N-acetyl-D-galactosamine dehydrogenase
VHDPVADAEHAKHEYGIELIGWGRPARGAGGDSCSAAPMPADGLSSRLAQKLGGPKVLIDVKAACNLAELGRDGVVGWQL